VWLHDHPLSAVSVACYPTACLAGNVSDCYLLSALAAAAQKAEVLDNIVLTPDLDESGVFAARFWIDGRWHDVLVRQQHRCGGCTRMHCLLGHAHALRRSTTTSQCCWTSMWSSPTALTSLGCRCRVRVCMPARCGRVTHPVSSGNGVSALSLPSGPPDPSKGHYYAPVFAGSRSRNELWMTLVEKAFAKYHGA